MEALRSDYRQHYLPPVRHKKVWRWSRISIIGKSPTFRLLFGFLITLSAVAGSSWYSLRQLSGLRKLQTQTIDANRHDSLLLLQVQNDLNAVGLKLRDMVQASDRSGVSQYQCDFERLRADLEDSIKEEARLAPVIRRPERQQELLRDLTSIAGNFGSGISVG